MSKVIPNLQLFFFLIFLSLSLLGLDLANFLNIPKSLLFYITNPISFGIYRTYQNTYKQFHFIFQSRFAAQENKALQEQLGQLLSENASLKRKLLETDAIIDQEHHLDPRIYNLIAARPIGLSRFLKIDKGSNAGFKLGQAVVFKDNYVGKIVHVSPNSSNVELLQDPNSKVSAFSLGVMGRAKGVLLGQFGSDLLLDKILHEEQINVGDLVYSEGTEGNLARGLILGRVSEVSKRENEVFKQAKVRGVFDIRDLELVFVIVE